MIGAGKLLVLVGVVILVIGIVVWALGRAGFRGMPGDIRYEGERVRIYFPIVTCLVVSLILTAILWAWRFFSRR